MCWVDRVWAGRFPSTPVSVSVILWLCPIIFSWGNFELPCGEFKNHWITTIRKLLVCVCVCVNNMWDKSESVFRDWIVWIVWLHSIESWDFNKVLFWEFGYEQLVALLGLCFGLVLLHLSVIVMILCVHTKVLSLSYLIQLCLHPVHVFIKLIFFLHCKSIQISDAETASFMMPNVPLGYLSSTQITTQTYHSPLEYWLSWTLKENILSWFYLFMS